MAVPENNEIKEHKLYNNELLPELEINIIPMKFSTEVRVDLHKLSDEFMQFLVTQGHIDDDVHNDIRFMCISDVPRFYSGMKTLYKLYKARESANLQV